MSSVEVKLKIQNILSMVPVGNVVSYGQLADLAGLPGRARLIGKCLKNTAHCVNWHRVLRADGKIAFPKDSIKAQEQQSLLQEEGVVVVRYRVNMNVYKWEPDLYTLLAKLTY